jgi:hypothetical protein
MVRFGCLVGRFSLVAALGAVGLAGCAGSDFTDKTAEVAVGGDQRTFEVESCGLDDQTIVLVARADDGAVLQAVVGLEEDGATGILASTGVTVDLDPGRVDTRVAAFGPEAWERRGSGGAVPGEITSARLRGSRIQLAGLAVPVDASDRPIDRAEPVELSVDARCDAEDQGDGGGEGE